MPEMTLNRFNWGQKQSRDTITWCYFSNVEKKKRRKNPNNLRMAFTRYTDLNTEANRRFTWMKEEITLHRPMSSLCCGHMISCIRHHGSHRNCWAARKECCVISLTATSFYMHWKLCILHTSCLLGKWSGVCWVFSFDWEFQAFVFLISLPPFSQILVFTLVRRFTLWENLL